MPDPYSYTMRANKDFSDDKFEYPHTVKLSEAEMVERIWARAPPGSKLPVYSFRVNVLLPGSSSSIELFQRAHLTRSWNLLADEDQWEFAQRLCELAYGTRDLFTEL